MNYDITKSDRVLDFAKTEREGILANTRALSDQIPEFIERSE